MKPRPFKYPSNNNKIDDMDITPIKTEKFDKAIRKVISDMDELHYSNNLLSTNKKSIK